ncbi:MAG: long-chain fatty aldehyde decarbonylase [Myxococcota bacterium]|nr:long-chain fatty aldehyde decarbonylase [Myxococcota bacterium]
MSAGREGPLEVHDLDLAQFEEEVHSFEFWFQSVEGYLSGRPYGHAPELAENGLDAAERDRLVTVLSNYCVGETAALEGASGLIGIAPNRHAKIFLSTQVVDEGRHLEVLLHRMRDLGVADPESEVERRASPSILEFRRRLLQLVESKDWEAAIFGQNVALEAMEFTVFQSHARMADPITREVLEGIVKDERRHIGFGENELGRRLRESPHRRARIREVKRDFDALVLETLDDAQRDIGIPVDDRQELGRGYLAAMARLGFE